MTTPPARSRHARRREKLRACVGAGMAGMLVVAASAGCGLLAPLHDLSADTGADPSSAPETDAANTTDPDPPDDLDASSSDEGAPPKDADADQDAGPPFCDRYYGDLGALACDDFDRGAPAGAWTTEGAGANLDVDVDPSASPSPALHISTITPYAGLPSVVLSRTLASGPRNVVCSFDLFTDLGDGDQAPVRLFTFGLKNGSDFWRVELVLQNGSIAATERTATTTRALAKTVAGAVQKGSRVPVIVSVTMTPAPHFQLQLANTIGAPTAEIAPTLDAGSLQTTLGMTFIGTPLKLWSTRVDNFLCHEK